MIRGGRCRCVRIRRGGNCKCFSAHLPRRGGCDVAEGHGGAEDEDFGDARGHEQLPVGGHHVELEHRKEEQRGQRDARDETGQARRVQGREHLRPPEGERQRARVREVESMADIIGARQKGWQERCLKTLRPAVPFEKA
eukprot:943499-Pleurochrysis_carterae.AAC.4